MTAKFPWLTGIRPRSIGHLTAHQPRCRSERSLPPRLLHRRLVEEVKLAQLGAYGLTRVVPFLPPVVGAQKVLSV